jgi:hypothetical protein
VPIAGGGGTKPSHHSGIEKPTCRLSVAKEESCASPPIRVSVECGIIVPFGRRGISPQARDLDCILRMLVTIS